MSDPKMVTIPLEEYLGLKEDSDKLLALEVMGVDNWSGYDEAMNDFWARRDS